MLSYVIILHVVHIVGASLWTGAAVMIAGFISPTVRITGPEGGRFMQRLVVGQAINARATSRISAIGREIQTAGGGPPNPAQVAEIQTMQERIRKGGGLGAALLVAATLLMSVARYLP